MSGVETICIRGARVHNLQNLDLDIPRDQFVVITGPSGSGKSSLAFDTLYAEGQRQYIESLSPHARQFLHQLERPDVDLMEGLQPTICIDQRPGQANPRSTVATVTEIYDYLRLLMARLGHVRCFQCGTEIRQQSPEQIQERLLALPEGTKLMLLAPMVRGRRGEHKDVFARIRRAGFLRARVDGTVYDLDAAPQLAARQVHHVDAIVDRLIVRPAIRSRLAESLRLALQYGDGLAVACYHDPQRGSDSGDTWRDELFSTFYACPECGLSYEELEPRTFSFNSPYGACVACDGLGRKIEFDPELVLPDLELSLADGAVAPLRSATAAISRKFMASMEPFLRQHRLDFDTPLKRLRQPARDKLLRGDGTSFEGVLIWLEKQLATTTRRKWKEHLESFRGEVTCPKCQGSRLRPEANSVRLGGKTIYEITQLSVRDAAEFFQQLSFSTDQRQVARPPVAEIHKRLEFLVKVGLDYLTLERPADTLSGGELQRVRLASSIGSGLVGVCYILDEPSIGLHPRDNGRLISALRELQELGNSVVVVEHDEAMMRAADWLIDFGPQAGSRGGRLMAQGSPQQVAERSEALTGQYLAGQLRIERPATRRRLTKSRSLLITGVRTNNLKGIDVRIPLSAFVCITGVSGSGKSSLVSETLTRAVARRLGLSAPKPGPQTGLRGVHKIDKLVVIDQMPIGRTPRSNPATYSGMFDEVRRVFASTRDAKQRGFGAGRFSFNVVGGRCETCQGQGVQKVEMNFLPDLYVTCSQCEGARFNEQTLQVRYRSRTIADVLEMDVDEGAEFFENFSKIHRLLRGLQDVGLGYLKLGQPSTTLSGGEAQRIKLGTELARVETGRTLYVLDEPTTGLHFDDIRKLLRVLQQLVDQGNTVIVVEHHLDVIKCADWVIDLGPEGGAAGGQIVAEGTPEDVASAAASYTGRFLSPLLG